MQMASSCCNRTLATYNVFGKFLPVVIITGSLFIQMYHAQNRQRLAVKGEAIRSVYIISESTNNKIGHTDVYKWSCVP